MKYLDNKGSRDKLVISESKKTNGYLFTKRFFDIVISSMALVVLSPVFLIVWILNMLNVSDRGPLFYKQTRIGLNGKEFGMYKFRSMVIDAEKKLYQNKELYRKYVANNYKLEPQNDPRITKLGRFLRKTSIDEIPQFINIIKGDMSLVGPRPVIENELVEYDKKSFCLLSLVLWDYGRHLVVVR